MSAAEPATYGVLLAEIRRLRILVAEILGKFTPVDPGEPHGRYAAVETAAMVEHWRKRARLKDDQ